MEGTNRVHIIEGKAVNGSVFSTVKLCPPDAVFNVKEKYLADKSPNKVNLGVGGKIICNSLSSLVLHKFKSMYSVCVCVLCDAVRPIRCICSLSY